MCRVLAAPLLALDHAQIQGGKAILNSNLNFQKGTDTFYRIELALLILHNTQMQGDKPILVLKIQVFKFWKKAQRQFERIWTDKHISSTYRVMALLLRIYMHTYTLCDIYNIL